MDFYGVTHGLLGDAPLLDGFCWSRLLLDRLEIARGREPRAPIRVEPIYPAPRYRSGLPPFTWSTINRSHRFCRARDPLAVPEECVVPRNVNFCQVLGEWLRAHRLSLQFTRVFCTVAADRLNETIRSSSNRPRTRVLLKHLHNRPCAFSFALRVQGQPHRVGHVHNGV
jgi:hypothetical protein